MSEQIGNIYKTLIPSYNDNADIQTALKIFLYGSASDEDINQSDPSQLVSPSIAKHLQNFQDSIDEILAIGVGSVYSDTEPTNPENGMIWVDSETSAPVPTQTFYQDSEPAGSIAQGSFWVDSDSSPLTMYVYDSSTGWKEIGA